MIYLIGTGCGKNSITDEAKKSIKECGFFTGSKRMGELLLEIYPEGFKSFYKNDSVSDYFSFIKEKGEDLNIAVLYSGDTGFFSGAPSLFKMLQDNNIKARMVPGISSFSYFFSRVGLSYFDTKIFSLHGKRFDFKIEPDTFKKYFFLTSNGDDVFFILKRIKEEVPHDAKKNLYIGENLGYENERIRSFDIDKEDIKNEIGEVFDLNIVYFSMGDLDE